MLLELDWLKSVLLRWLLLSANLAWPFSAWSFSAWSCFYLLAFSPAFLKEGANQLQSSMLFSSQSRRTVVTTQQQCQFLWSPVRLSCSRRFSDASGRCRGGRNLFNLEMLHKSSLSFILVQVLKETQLFALSTLALDGAPFYCYLEMQASEKRPEGKMYKFRKLLEEFTPSHSIFEGMSSLVWAGGCGYISTKCCTGVLVSFPVFQWQPPQFWVTCRLLSFNIELAVIDIFVLFDF